MFQLACAQVLPSSCCQVERHAVHLEPIYTRFWTRKKDRFYARLQGDVDGQLFCPFRISFLAHPERKHDRRKQLGNTNSGLVETTPPRSRQGHNGEPTWTRTRRDKSKVTYMLRRISRDAAKNLAPRRTNLAGQGPTWVSKVVASARGGRILNPSKWNPSVFCHPPPLSRLSQIVQVQNRCG